MVAAGIDVKTAQTRLGHSDPRLTLAVYAQATNAADRAAADRLGALFMADGTSDGTSEMCHESAMADVPTPGPPS